MSAPAALLRVVHVSKRYRLEQGGEFEAVRDVSFEVNSGECLGLLGPNGAGKSTIIQCISGFYPTSEGRVFIAEHDVWRDPKRARQELGVCNQEDTLDSDFNVFDQLVRHGSYFRLPAQLARERAQRLVAQFGLMDKLNDPIESLSGGLRRRLQVARAFISEPKVLVLDEPTTGLDPDARRVLWDVLARARGRGVAILLCTHYMEEAERLCDRIALLHQGRLLDLDTPERLIDKHVGKAEVEEEVRPGVVWKRSPNLEDVFLKLAGHGLGADTT